VALREQHVNGAVVIQVDLPSYLASPHMQGSAVGDSYSLASHETPMEKYVNNCRKGLLQWSLMTYINCLAPMELNKLYSKNPLQTALHQCAQLLDPLLLWKSVQNHSGALLTGSEVCGLEGVRI
jgi:hypothetical protein